jgi:hypothetical protein
MLEKGARLMMMVEDIYWLKIFIWKKLAALFRDIYYFPKRGICPK